MGKTTYLRTRAGLLRASSIIGCGVEDVAGEDLGRIEDLVIDALQGRVAYAILSFGESLGLEDKLFAIPLPALSYRADDRKFILHVDRDTLRRAPGFEKDRWPDMNQRPWADEIYAHYGYPPYWE
jgi:PRC-barrel domain protein